MTNNDELALKLKKLAQSAGADEWQSKKISGDQYVIRKGSYQAVSGYRTYQPIAEIDHKPTRDYVAYASPAAILALLAERDADKALIVEQDARLIEYARIATENAARTLTVKLPEAATVGGQGYRKKAIWVLQEACFDAGITLVVEE